MTQEQFKDSMTYLGLAYGKEYTQNELQLYYDFLKEYSDETLVNAIKNLIKKSKYLPKISDLVEECENFKSQIRFEVIEFMKDKGYFKSSNEYDKTIMWYSKGITPKWLLEDMKKYYKLMQQEKLVYNNQLMISM